MFVYLSLFFVCVIGGSASVSVCLCLSLLVFVDPPILLYSSLTIFCVLRWINIIIYNDVPLNR